MRQALESRVPYPLFAGVVAETESVSVRLCGNIAGRIPEHGWKGDAAAMEAPTSVPALLILIAFVIPGAVYGLVFERTAGPLRSNEMGLRILRAITVSTIFHAVYLIIGARYIVKKYEVLATAFDKNTRSGYDTVASSLQTYGWLIALYLLVFPAIIGLLVALLARTEAVHSLATEILYVPPPSAWDAMFANQEHAWVRVQKEDGTWLGGKWIGGAVASSTGSPQEVFLPTQVRMSEDGEFEEILQTSAGIWIRCHNARRVEVFR